MLSPRFQIEGVLSQPLPQRSIHETPAAWANAAPAPRQCMLSSACGVLITGLKSSGSFTSKTPALS